MPRSRAGSAQGTGKAAKFDREVAGKTGTSQLLRDAWFVGFSSDIVAGVWFGNDNDSPMDGITGGTAPARLWRDFMIKAHEGTPTKKLANLNLITELKKVKKNREKTLKGNNIFERIIENFMSED